MEVPSGFQARMREMTDTLQQRKQLLEAERQLQSARRKALQEANDKVEQIQRMTFALKDKTEKMSTEISCLERTRGAAHVQLEDILHKTRQLVEQIIELEQEKEETSSFYERNQEEMESYQKKFKEQISSLEYEIEKLQKEYDELRRSESKRKRQLREVDTAIEEEEEKGPKLASMKEEVINEIVANSIKVEKLEAAVQEAVKESKKKQVELDGTLKARRNEVISLQQQNQHWENRVFQRIQSRAQMQRDLETLENRIAHTSKALYG